MITVFLYFLAATAVSLGGLWLLMKTDRKRQRVFFKTIETKASGVTLAAWIATLVPGAVLLTAAQYSAFLSWIGSLTVVGWILAARPPLAATRSTVRDRP